VKSSRVNIADMPVDERPRERMMRGGAASLSDAELLAILLEPGRQGKSSIDLAREVVADGLLALARREWVPGRVGNLGPARVARIAAALELARRIAALTPTSGDPVTEPSSLATRLVGRYGHCVQERFGVICLDARNRIISEREISVGSLTSSNVSPRDVFRFALSDHAAAVIVFHNHPSGDPAPSAQDLAFTRKLVDVGKGLDVPVFDHLVVACTGYVSLKQRQFM
jgi:DNA repair protein RadC